MPLLKKVWFGIIIPMVIVLAWERVSSADNDWQLDEGPAEMSETEEIELGNQTDAYIKRQFYLDNDSVLNKIITDITQRLVIVSDRKTLPFTCNIIQSSSINAFSAPGGHIYMTDCLLKFAKTEDEIAGIIAHEVAHASLRHASKLYHEVKEIFSHQDNETDSAATFLLLSSHLEEFEQEADTVGVLYAYKAGFDPNGLPDFLERHLDFMIHIRIFSVLSFSSTTAVRLRITHLREYLSSLEEKETKNAPEY